MTPGAIQMASGHLVFPLALQTEDIMFFDIAHALSNKCRFTGHTKKFYSVAEHSVLVSLVAEDLARRAGLSDRLIKLHAQQGVLHDCDETYLPDIPTPIKYLPECTFLREAGKRIFVTAMRVFDLPETELLLVKQADKILLVTEKRDLMSPVSGWEKEYAEQPLTNLKIVGMPPEQAHEYFVARFEQVFGVKVS